MIVRVSAVPKKPEGNSQKTGCLDTDGKEIEYGKKILMQSLRVCPGDSLRFDIKEQEIIPQRIPGMQGGFYADFDGGRVYCEASSDRVSAFKVIEESKNQPNWLETRCFDKNGNPIYIGSYLCFYPESVKLFGYVMGIESCYLIFNTKFGTARIKYAQGERLDCQVVK